MVHAEVLLVPEIHEAVVAPPAIGVDDASRVHTTSDDGLEMTFLRIWDDLRVDLPVPLEDPEDDRLPAGAAASLAADAAGAEVRLIGFDLATEWRLALAVLRNSPAQGFEITVHGHATHSGDLGDFGGLQIDGKEPQQLAEFPLCNSGTEAVPVFHEKDEVKRTSETSQRFMSLEQYDISFHKPVHAAILPIAVEFS